MKKITVKSNGKGKLSFTIQVGLQKYTEDLTREEGNALIEDIIRADEDAKRECCTMCIKGMLKKS